MRSWIWLMLGGCNQIFGLDPTVSQKPDARLDAPGCGDVMFGNPIELKGAAFPGNTVDYDPSTTGNPNEIWFTREVASGDFDLQFATRIDETQNWDVHGLFASNTSNSEGDAQLPADGLSLVFVSDRTGAFYAYESTRSTVNDGFGLPTPIAPSLDQNDAMNGIELSFDGLRLYYADTSAELHMMERPARGQPFGPPGPTLMTNVYYPTLSPDERELFYERKDGSGATLGEFHTTRSSTSVPFDAAFTPFMNGAADADVSPDAEHLYYSQTGTLVVMTRMCN